MISITITSSINEKPRRLFMLMTAPLLIQRFAPREFLAQDRTQRGDLLANDGSRGSLGASRELVVAGAGTHVQAGRRRQPGAERCAHADIAIGIQTKAGAGGCTER